MTDQVIFRDYELDEALNLLNPANAPDPFDIAGWNQIVAPSHHSL